jgi:hypothetical protein
VADRHKNYVAQEKPFGALPLQPLSVDVPIKLEQLKSLFTFLSLHSGQTTGSSSVMKTNFSKQLLQVLHRYSYIGMHNRH